jgi:hypothetical protein
MSSYGLKTTNPERGQKILETLRMSAEKEPRSLSIFVIMPLRITRYNRKNSYTVYFKPDI